MSHRWVSKNRPDDGSYAECDWCAASAYAQAENGKIVLRYTSGIFGPEDSASFNHTLKVEPPCSGREGIFYEHDFDFLHESTARDGTYTCVRCDYKISSDFSINTWPEPDCVEKKS